MKNENVPNRKRIAVIGGGASGCMAAIAAAQKGCLVRVFEKNEKIAKKIYATGNGRCNLTNLSLDSTCYKTGAHLFSKSEQEEDRTRILSFIDRFNPHDLISFFSESGVPVHDRSGYVYPRTDQAETVALALEKRMFQSGIRVMTSCSVEEIRQIRPTGSASASFRILYKTQESQAASGKGKRASGGSQSKSAQVLPGPGNKTSREKNTQSFDCDAVILCTGGLAGPSFGCSGDGYRLAEPYSHHIIKPLPSLTRLTCNDRILRRAAGVRCHASITLLSEKEAGSVNREESSACVNTQKKAIGYEEGELQITEDGISGIPVFQLSGTAARFLDRGLHVSALIDFLPEFTQEVFSQEIERRLSEDRNQMLGSLMLGLVHRKVIDMVLACENLQAEMKAKRLTDDSLRRLFQKLRCFETEVTGTGPFTHAQVTSGGIPLSEITDHLESKYCRGLFFAGELLDVDGLCGGYNLQWAMTSGVIAGIAAAEPEGLTVL